MSIYISKSAINNIPLPEDTLITDNNGGKLQNQPLVNNRYLVGLAKNETGYKKLKLDSQGSYIINIKMALLAIKQIYSSYTIVNDLDVNSDLFDSNLESAVMSFQSWVALSVTGVVDPETLLAMDSKLSSQDIFDYRSKKYKGKLNLNTSIQIDSKANANGDLKSFEIIIDGGEKITIKTNKKLNAKVIVKDNSAISGNVVNILADSEFQKDINANIAVQALNKQRKIDGISEPISVQIDPSKYDILKTNGSTSLLNIDDELFTNTPPLLFDDPDSKLYEIKPGDTPSKIVIDNYYGGIGYPIMDPYKNIPIYTLPPRTPFAKENRSEDARFQFYLNLLYYYNSDDSTETLKEWGLEKKSSYQRYPISHLDDVNIFDTEYKSSDPNPALPNYYRFLKKMETLNPASKIIFDSNGNTTSFRTVTGKNIRIPSRKFADSMYNFLNFRHNEMLVPVVIPGWYGADPKTKMVYAADQVLTDLIKNVTDVIDSITSIITEVKDDAKQLYNETAAFFKKVYNFAIKSLTQYWPRGAGGKIAFGADITWGIPINTEGKLEKSIYRKMSKEDELTIVYKTEATLGVSVNEYQGFRTGFGQNSGHGNSNKRLGINTGVGLHAGIKTIVSTEYEFPIREDETALLTMIVTTFGGTIISSTAEVLRMLDVISLDPRQYISKFEVALEGDAKAKIEAELKTGGLEGISMPNSNRDDDPSENSMFGGIHNIFSYLPGISSELSFVAGYSLSYEVDYGSNPFTPNHGGRVFETIEIDIKNSAQLVLETKLMAGFFKKLFINALPVIGTVVDTILNLLSFDAGCMLGVSYKLERKAKSHLIRNTDFEFDVFDETALNLVTGSTLTYTKETDRISKEISLYFGTFTGDVDTLCEPGTEVKYVIDMGTFFKMLKNNPAYDFNLNNTLKLFKSIEYHKKVGAFNFDTSTKKRIILKPQNDNNLTEEVVIAHRKGDQNNTEISLTTTLLEASLANLKSDKFFVTGGLALDIKMEIDFATLRHIFEFYFNKLYLKYVLNGIDDTDKHNKIEASITNHKDKIVTAMKANDVTEETGIKYYTDLYSDELVPDTTIPGLLNFIEMKINSQILLLNNQHKPIPTFIGTIKKFLKGISINSLFLNGTKPITADDLDYGITEIINAFNFIAATTGLEITLEGKAGLGFEFEIEGGADLLTAGAGLNALAEITYQGTLYEKGALTDLEINDPLRAVYQEIHKILGAGSENKRVGAKTVFGLLNK